MDALHVRRLQARYRLPAGDGGGRARLDRVLRDLLRESMDAALDQAGVPVHEEVCVRHVDAPARLRAGDGDDAMAAAWSAALARAIRATVDAGGANVVRYGSRGHAVVDVLLSVAAGDLRRAWAWRQMEMWRETDAPPPAAAAEEAARVLVSHPESIVSALAEAARVGALPALAARIRPAMWTAVARAALQAAGAETSVPALLASPSPASPSATTGIADGARETAESPAVDLSAERIVGASSIARVAVSVPEEAREMRRALAILAVLEVEPAAFLRPAEGRAIASAVEQTIGTSGDTRRVSPASPDADVLARRNRASDRGAPTSDVSRATPDEAEQPIRDASSSEDAGESVDWIPGAEDATGSASPVSHGASPETEETADVRPASPDDRRSAERESVWTGDVSPVVDGEEDEGDDVPVVRVEGETRWGGLLFLVPVIGQPEILREMLEGAALADRPLRWTLHRLATEMVGAAERDPGALALAGLAPDRDPPSRGAPPATEAEARAVADLAVRMARDTHHRIRREPARDAREALATARDVCRRDATIVADPGWIDVRMAHDEVRVDVRRAGLDLDPGWVPWLGAAVRFVYE